MSKPMSIADSLRLATRISCLIVMAAWLWGCESTATRSGGAGESVIESLSNSERKKYDEGLVHLADGRPKLAEQELSQLARARPDVAEIWLNLALSQYQQGNLGQAEATLTVLISDLGDFSEAHNLAGLIAVEKGDFGKAATHYQQAIDLKPNYSHALYNMALLQDVYLQDIASAVAFYERYLRLEPEDTDTKNWANGLKMSLGR